jgi:hypothetical protein
VIVVKELAQGGFGNVFLVKDSTNQNVLYAMKQMICQSQEQVWLFSNLNTMPFYLRIFYYDVIILALFEKKRLMKLTMN